MSANNKNMSMRHALLYVLKLYPASYAAMAAMGLLNSGAALLSALCIQRIFVVVTGGYSSELLLTLLLYFFVLLLSGAYSVWYMRYIVQFKVSLKFESKIRKRLHTKSRRISNEEIESPEADAFIRQADGARQNLFRFGQIYVESVTIIIQAAIITAYVSSFQISFLLFLPLAVIPVLIEILYKTKLWSREFNAIEQCRREEEEYERAVTDFTACKETRVACAAPLFTQKYKSVRKMREEAEERQSSKMFVLRLCMSALECAGSIGGFVTAILLFYFGWIDLATFSASIAAYSSLIAVLGGMAGTAGNERQYRQMIKPYFGYIGLPERGGERCDCKFEREISLKNVSFAYPGGGLALDDVSLTIERGEVIAVVGENGAGKTTLVNLILGLYSPTSGSVSYDGEDIADIDESVLHKRQSAVYQNFVRYKMTVGENICIADFSKTDEEATEGQIARIFPCGEADRDTLLGKEFGGKEISGGQWQKLAVARGFYKDADFIALDEPTSAIDPSGESAIYKTFKEGLRGRTGIIVTHRLGAVKLADRIIVLSRGKIAECGTHSELMAAKGLYYNFFKSQKGMYEEAE